jgi:hypothetical protein
MEREYLENLHRLGNVMIFPEEELPYTQNFTVRLEFHCFLAFLRKPFWNSHQPVMFSIFDRVM